MAQLWALLPASGAAAIITAVNALADRVAPDDPRCVEQRRADALVQLGLNVITGQASTGELPTRQRMKPAVQVTVALSTLLGLDEQPGELDGHGPIPASVARIAADETGTWRRLLTDEQGRLLDYGRTTYRPPKDLTDHVIARDRTCRFGHRNRSARRCEIDHRMRYSNGGTTSADNCQALCPRHHHVKDDDTGWTVQPLDTGDLKWTVTLFNERRHPIVIASNRSRRNTEDTTGA